MHHNYDVQAAEANVLQARGLRMIAASSWFPQITADFNATKTYFSKNGPVFAIGAAAGNPGVTTSSLTGLPFSLQIPQIQSLYNALLDATWEIDLFGKTRRSVEAAQANIESALEQRNDRLISVLAEVARNYIEIRSSQRLAVLTEENIKLLKQNVEIIKVSVERGLSNQLDLENIESQLDVAKAALPSLIAQVYRGIYAISVLTGELPETLAEEILPLKPLPKLQEKVAVGLRSDLLRRRPDVRRAERQLAGATANIGVAVASFFPTVTLLADGGFQSLKLSKLFQLPSKTWAVGGDINLPIFQGGQLMGNLKTNRAIASQAAFTYQQTVLNAVQDAESALVTYGEDLKTTQEFRKSVFRNRNIVKLTKQRYTKGLISLINLITIKRQFISTQESLLQSQTTALVDLIALYKALGGGWEPLVKEELGL
jgi:NodT family efflux transporter outer membrane factor (OMF) lipoprotein